MVLTLIDSHDVIRVESLIFHVYGDPGIGKSTLGNMAEKVLTLDFDRSAHRALGRQRTMRMDSWQDTEEILKHPAFDECQLLVIDTVGRALDMLADFIISDDPKLGSVVTGLNQRGWGALKERFRVFFRQVRGRGKDVLLLSHSKLDKDKDGNKTAAPDIQGGSAGEVFKVADAMAYYTVLGGRRVLDFNATDAHIGKNPAAWEPSAIPNYSTDPRAFGGLVQKLKDHLNALSDEQALVLQGVTDWQAKVEELEAKPKALTDAIPTIDAIDHPAVKAQAKTILWRRAKALGFEFDKDKRQFVKPKAKEEQPEAAEVA